MGEASAAPSVGAVAIGRNEGDRLKHCLAAALREVGDPGAIVYVDSGSADGSVRFARSLGVNVVELDTAIPFTAARARNAGVAALRSARPGVVFVQLLDGDCELEAGYLAAALAALDAQEKRAVVSGRRRERHRDATPYNRLCDMEWDTPIGTVRSCHGDATVRLSAFEQVGGFDETLIAGEEPELCVRLRAAGWMIERIDRPMTIHDAAMTRFSQWWKRQVRAGHAYGEGAFLHGAPPERHNIKPVRSALAWGVGWPVALGVCVLAALVLSPWLWVVAALVLLGPVILAAKVVRSRRRRGDAPRDARLYGVMTVIGKLPTALGVLKFHLNRMTGRRATLIEYKGRDADAGGGGARGDRSGA